MIYLAKCKCGHFFCKKKCIDIVCILLVKNKKFPKSIPWKITCIYMVKAVAASGLNRGKIRVILKSKFKQNIVKYSGTFIIYTFSFRGMRAKKA